MAGDGGRGGRGAVAVGRPDLLSGFALATLAALVVVSVAGSWLPYGHAGDLGHARPLLAPAPSGGWDLLGTDHLGRAMIPRLLAGVRVTFLVAVPPAVLAAAVASFLAALAAYVGGWLDTLISRAVDLLFTFPSILLALLLVSIIGPGSASAVTGIALIVSPQVLRVVRARALEVVPREFVRSSRVSGASPLRVVVTHLLPNVSGVVIVQATVAVVVAMLVESGLSFLGLGVTPPAASLGSLVHDGYVYLVSQPWLVFEPAAVLALIIFSINIVGDWLRDRLEVREVANLS
jgi:peptide/nickel transport system permease protein